jgi:hypothetical protein
MAISLAKNCMKIARLRCGFQKCKSNIERGLLPFDVQINIKPAMEKGYEVTFRD